MGERPNENTEKRTRHPALPCSHRWFTRTRATWAAYLTLLLIAVAAASAVIAGYHSIPRFTSPQRSAATLAAGFAHLEKELHAVMGIAISAVSRNHTPLVLGDWQSGPAWSTMKVPLAIAALRTKDPPEVTDAIRAAITQSDNAAAESIWEDLGDPVTAAHRVEAVLREAGDLTNVQSERVRPEFSAFGQTDWSITNQVRFTAAAACDNRDAAILRLMGQVRSDQRWGLGVIPESRFKGGWGPAITGRYLVRQIGLLVTPAGMTAVAMAAEPASGSFTDGIEDLTEIGEWLSAHMAALPSGQCGG